MEYKHLGIDERIYIENQLKFKVKIGECYFKTTLPSGKLCIKKIQVSSN